MEDVDELFVGDLARVCAVDDVEHVVEFAARRREFYSQRYKTQSTKFTVYHCLSVCLSVCFNAYCSHIEYCIVICVAY